MKGETMETNLDVLNKISQKLGGSADATSVTESLNNIANALGDTNPDVIKSVSDSLNDILEYAGGGGGSSYTNPIISIKYVNNTGTSIEVAGFSTSGYIYNNTLYGGGGSEPVISIANGQYATFECVALLTNDPEYPYNTQIPLSADANSYTASDEVNCTYDEEWVLVNDPTSTASITITAS